MSTSLEEKKGLINSSLPFLKKKFNVSKIGIFGSIARNESNIDSDIDILVEFDKIPGLFAFIELENYLTVLLGRKADLVTKNALKPIVKKEVMKDIEYV